MGMHARMTMLTGAPCHVRVRTTQEAAAAACVWEVLKLALLRRASLRATPELVVLQWEDEDVLQLVRGRSRFVSPPFALSWD